MAQSEGKSVTEFLKGFRSDATRETYHKKLRYFLDWLGISADEFLEKSKKNRPWAEKQIISYIEARKKEVSGSTIRQLRDALKHFYEMNDVENGVNWAKIVKMMPRVKRIGSDRAPTAEEIKKIIENSDLRMKCIVLLMCSSGIRVGAFDYLTWRDVEPMTREEKGEEKVVAAKLTVYRGEPEQYSSFITPECYKALLEYKSRREAIGEVIKPDSPLIRDNWDRNKYRKARIPDPKTAIRLSSKAIRNEVGELLEQIGLRNGSGKHEFKQVHGFRKFFKSECERYVKSIYVEMFMGHSLGVSDSYMRPRMDDMLDEYLKAVPSLSIMEQIHDERAERLRNALASVDLLIENPDERERIKQMIETAGPKAEYDEVMSKVRQMLRNSEGDPLFSWAREAKGNQASPPRQRIICKESEVPQYLERGYVPKFEMRSGNVVMEYDI
jgi:integrase